MSQPVRRIRLQFHEGSTAFDSLSAIERIGPHLFLGSDESQSLERLTASDGGQSFAAHRSFPVGDFIPLPGDDEEIDVEGLSYSAPYLWLVGSHSLKRQKPRPDDDAAKQIERLGRVKPEANRYVLARIPVVENRSTGEFSPAEGAANPSGGDDLRAAHLAYGKHGNALIEALKADPHLGPFLPRAELKDEAIKLSLPSKDNGFDIEGLAARGNRLFVGLRGPVLRGWAMVIELAVEAAAAELRLREIGPQSQTYRKHFLRLDGLGVRDLIWRGDDLLVLVGPTMDLDGPVRVFRWRGVTNLGRETITPRDELEVLLDVPFGDGADHAEGMTLLGDGESPASLLVVYDSPAAGRKAGATEVFADVFTLPD